jgi:glycosyltransferase involved in cell wall biosynthesis
LRLDIVIPAHNEEHRIGRTLGAYRTGCPHPDTRFLVALDACTDRTAEIVREHRAQDDRVSLHEYAKLGKGGVIAATFRRSNADYVAFVDADCATPPSELLRLAETTAQEGADVDGAIASRNHPASVLPVARSLMRRVTSAGFSFSVRRLMRLPYSDTQCGAKVLRRKAAQDIVERVSETDLLFDVDLLLAARDAGHRVVEVPTVWIDQDGSRVKPIVDARKMGMSLACLWVAAMRRRWFGPPLEVADARA